MKKFFSQFCLTFQLVQSERFYQTNARIPRNQIVTSIFDSRLILGLIGRLFKYLQQSGKKFAKVSAVLKSI